MVLDLPARLARAAAAFALTLAAGASAQQATAPVEGLRDATPRLHALTNARIVTEPGRVIERGTVVLRDGLVESVEAGDRVPAGATRWDLGGKTVFAGFIELESSLAVPAAFKPVPMPAPGAPPAAPAAPESGARHWNRLIRPERDVAAVLEPRADETKALRGLGFTSAVAEPTAGVLRGQSALLALRDAANPREILLAPRVFQHAAFELGNAAIAEYPGSLMGATALLRQSLLDAQWQREQRAAPGARERAEANPALDALAALLARTQKLVFATEDELDVGRVLELAAEFKLDTVIAGNGTEYRVLGRLQQAKAPVIVPLAFPAAPPVERVELALDTSLAQLQHWEQAPANAARLAAAGVPIALTTRGLKDPGKEFWPNLRRAVAAGLGEDAALRALTLTPAQIAGQGARLGRIAVGHSANLVVADAELFRASNAAIFAVWVDGVRHELKPLPGVDPRGTWRVAWADGKGPTTLEISGDGPYDIKAGELTIKAALVEQRLLLPAPNAWFGGGSGEQAVSLAWRDGRLDGLRALADGSTVAVHGERSAAAPAAAPMKAVDVVQVPPFRGYPAGEYGRLAPPEQPPVLLVRNATIWTQGPQGKLENADLLVRGGRIAAIGSGLDVPADAQVIDASGLHLTPGIIDAHSHTAVARNVNEPSHAVTTEVRIGDALDPTDIGIYWQLAGGVTAAHLLHGSANPMGGQSQIVKWRWGSDANGLRFAGATPSIKFALGENVKQANWGDAFVTRYPQSRMGVEQIMLDSFNAARAYGDRQDAWRKDKDGPAPRRDLRLEALLEILRGERLVHIHSYRQDEILMFARLSQRFGFKVAAFQHVLEGYKVADTLAAIGAGASTFSDWWAFKMEVYDAIPYNGALLTGQGVLTSFNSDSGELARRLNSEAGKALKYGMLDEQQALALVTSNPARQLRIDARVGSLEPGMDADFVLWRGNPLSSLSRAEQTWIEGRRYFDRAEDALAQRAVAAERERLLAKALPERLRELAGAPAPVAAGKPTPSLHDLHSAHDAANQQIADWAIQYAARRGIYHAGQDVVGCSVAEHQH